MTVTSDSNALDKQAAEEPSRAVILSAAKDRALRIFLKMHRTRFFSRKAGSE
ncbi:MAG: hypothetical protein ACLQVM_10540 [Terriglobia bacterium]